MTHLTQTKKNYATSIKGIHTSLEALREELIECKEELKEKLMSPAEKRALTVHIESLKAAIIYKENRIKSYHAIAVAQRLIKTLDGIKENIHRVLNNHAEGEEMSAEELRTFIGSLAEIAENEINQATK